MDGVFVSDAMHVHVHRELDAAQRLVVELPDGEEIQVIVAEVGQDLEDRIELALDGPLDVGERTLFRYGPVEIVVGLPYDDDDEKLDEEAGLMSLVMTRLVAQIREFWWLAAHGRWAYEDRGRWWWPLRGVRSLLVLPEAQSCLMGPGNWDPSWLDKVVCTWRLAGEGVDEDLAEEVRS